MSYSEKMLAALQEEDLAEAQLMLAEALRKDEPDMLASLGEELLALGFLEEAKQVFEELLTQFPEEDSLNVPLAEIAIEDDQIDEAFDLLDAIANDSPAYVQSLLVKADLYQLMGVPEVSEAKLKEAQQLMPDEPLIRFALGELYFTNGQFAEAAVEYQALLQEDFTNLSRISLNERIGSALSMQGLFEEAVPFLEEAIKEGQTDDRLFQLAFTYLQMKDNQKAIFLLQQLRLLNPHYQSLYVYLAEALQEEELLEEAQEVLEDGLKEDPYQVDLYHLAAENAYRLHDAAESERLLNKALELDGKQEETILTLSNLYLNEERFEDVIEVLAELEEAEPLGEWNLAQAYEGLEEFAQAAEHYQNAYRDLNHDPEFLKAYGIFLREEGRNEEARQMLTHYLAHVPDDIEIQNLLNDLEERG